MGSTETPAVPRVNIISDEIVRPPSATNQSILRSYLDNGVNKCSSKVATTSSMDVGCRESQLNLLEGLGEDFLANNPPNGIEQLFLEDLDAFFAADPTEGQVEEIVPHIGTINQIGADANEELESAIQILEKVSNQATSTSSLDFDRPPSPIIGNKESKRKMGKGGKGPKKVCRRSSKDKVSSSSSNSELLILSQAEDNAVVQNFKKLVAAAAEKKKYYERLEEESRGQRMTILRRREEAEAQQQIHDNNLHQALEQLKQLKSVVAKHRAYCRENNKLIESLKAGEKKMTNKYNQEQLDKYSRRLTKLQKISLDIS